MQFGHLIAGSYVIPAWWQSLWNALSQVGTMLGAWSIGFIADRFGRKICFATAACVSAAGIAVLYISETPGVFLGGKIINAFSLGMAIAVGQTYVSEITPLPMRSVALSGFTFSMVSWTFANPFSLHSDNLLLIHHLSWLLLTQHKRKELRVYDSSIGGI